MKAQSRGFDASLIGTRRAPAISCLLNRSTYAGKEVTWR
jgi:hypothetical protein